MVGMRLEMMRAESLSGQVVSVWVRTRLKPEVVEMGERSGERVM